MATVIQITFDCADPARLAAFWAAALGYQLDPPPAGFDSWDAFLDAAGVPAEHRNDRSAVSDPDGIGPRLYFQKVPEGKAAKNRLHLDLRAAPGIRDADERMAALRARGAELEALGAAILEEHAPDPRLRDAGFIVMRDPEQNEFCLD